MKYIIVFLVFTFLLGVSYAQEIEKVSVEEYAKYLQKIKNEYVTQNRTSEIDLSKAKKMVYLAYHNNPVVLKKNIYDELDIIKKRCKNGEKEKYRRLLGERKYLANAYLDRLLRERIDTLEYNLINTHLLLRGKVLQKRIVNKKASNSSLPPLKLAFLKIQIEDVVIGNASINNDMDGSIIEVYYSTRFVNDSEKWEISKTYLFNLGYTLSSTSEGKPRIMEYGNDGIFAIQNNFIIDRTNFYGFGEKIKWNDFKNKITGIVENIIK